MSQEKEDKDRKEKKRSWGRYIMWWVGALSCVYLVVCAFFFVIQRRMLYPLGVVRVPANVSLGPGAELLKEKRAFGEIEAIFLKNPKATVENPAPLLVFTHGNGESIDSSMLSMRRYVSMGFHVLLPEYRGYGRTAGSPTQEGIVEDVLMWIDKVSARPEVDGGRLVYHGFSLGGGVAGAVAAKKPPHTLILQSTFRSIGAMAYGMGLPGFLARDPYDTESLVRDWKKPLLVIHGTEDEIVPFAHGKALATMVPQAEFHTYDCGHGMFACAVGYWDNVHKFLVRARVLEKKGGKGS